MTLKQTPLHAEHEKLGALMVDFAGWSMPLHYGSQIEEHHSVRQDAGMFDVSHMGVLDVTGKDVAPFLRYVLANNIDKLKNPGRALYTCMLNHQGGVIDDLIVYYIAPTHYRLIVNASTLEKDLAWLLNEAKTSGKPFEVSISYQKQLGILAVQGPNARTKVIQALNTLISQDKIQLPPNFPKDIDVLKPFQFLFDKLSNVLIARTGYTGEDGVEMVVPHEAMVDLWQVLLAANVRPVGLGARDTLRLEAGLNLYGQDMDETVTPLESNLSWTVAFEPNDRDFIGRAALIQQRNQGMQHQLTGIRLIDKGVLRHDQTVWVAESQIGKITSGSFSPTLKQSIALARIGNGFNNGCAVDIRGKHLKAEIVPPPFVKKPEIRS